MVIVNCRCTSLLSLVARPRNERNHAFRICSLVPVTSRSVGRILFSGKTVHELSSFYQTETSSHIAEQFPQNTEQQSLETIGQEPRRQTPSEQRKNTLSSDDLLCSCPYFISPHSYNSDMTYSNQRSSRELVDMS